jgi:STE24 endopeptidase
MIDADIQRETLALLSTIDPAVLERARRYTSGGHWIVVVDAFVTVGVCIAILKSTLIARIHAAVLRPGRPKPKLAAFASCFVFFVLLDLLRLPWDLYVEWYRESIYGLTGMTAPAWLTEWLLLLPLEALVWALLFTTIYVLLRRLRSWRALVVGTTTGVVMGAVLLVYPMFIAPLFNEFEAAPEGPVRRLAIELGTAAGVPPERITVFDGSRQSERYTARVSGMLGFARIAMSDTMFRDGVDVSEVAAVLAHELGHYAEAHTLWTVAFYALLVGCLWYLVELSFARTRPWVFGPGGPAIESPTAIPLVVLLFTLFILLVSPMTNGFTRLLETRADEYSLRVAREPGVLIRALLKTVDYRAPSPPRWAEILFYDHPAIERRIYRAVTWKRTGTSGDAVGDAPNKADR